MQRILVVLGMCILLSGCAWYKENIKPYVDPIHDQLCGDDHILDLNLGGVGISFDCSRDKGKDGYESYPGPHEKDKDKD